MAKVDEILRKAEKLISGLDFDGCEELFNRHPAGHKMIDLVFERMEALDPERFEEWMG